MYICIYICGCTNKQIVHVNELCSVFSVAVTKIPTKSRLGRKKLIIPYKLQPLSRKAQAEIEAELHRNTAY